MTWTLAASGTKTPFIPTTCTFTNASAVVTGANAFAAGDLVMFTTTGTVPTNFATYTPYYVIATGLSGTQFEASATLGGTAITAGSAGTGTHTFTPEQVLATDATNASFVFEADLTNAALADLFNLRFYTKTLTGGVYGLMWEGSYQHAQALVHKAAPPVASDIGVMVTLRQLAGTARAIPWKLLRI